MMFRHKDDYGKLCKVLGYEFKNKKLLLQALTRLSGLNEGRQLAEIGHFQRLEFVGDKVLNLVIGDILLETYPLWNEGRLTQETARWINNSGPLAAVANNLQLGEFLIMGRGEEKTNRARKNVKVLSDAMEALIGALWLDTQRNYDFMKEFIMKHWLPLGMLPASYKSLEMIIRDENLASADKIRRFKSVLNNEIEQAIIENIFELAVDECEELEIVECLLKTGRISQFHLDYALIRSIEQNIPEQVELSLNYGANPNFILSSYSGATRSLSVLQIALLQAEDTSEYKEINKIVEVLLKMGADPNWQGSIGFMMMDEIVENVKEELYSTCFFEMESEEFGGMTLGQIYQSPRYTKSKLSDQATKKPAQERHAPRNIEYKDLTTALHMAAQLNTIDMPTTLKLLLQNQADPNLQNNEGQTPLHLLCENYYKSAAANIIDLADSIERFITANANPLLTDNNGDTPLGILQKYYQLFIAENPFVKDDLDHSIQKLKISQSELKFTRAYPLVQMDALLAHSLLGQKKNQNEQTTTREKKELHGTTYSNAKEPNNLKKP